MSTSRTVAKRDFQNVQFYNRKTDISAAPAQRQQQRAGNRTSKQASTCHGGVSGLLGASRGVSWVPSGGHKCAILHKLYKQNVKFYIRFIRCCPSGRKHVSTMQKERGRNLIANRIVFESTNCRLSNKQASKHLYRAWASWGQPVLPDEQTNKQAKQMYFAFLHWLCHGAVWRQHSQPRA